MKIEKYFDEKLKRWLWRVDFTIGGQRIRMKDFPTRKNADDFIIAAKNKARDHRLGLSRPAPPTITLQQLYDRRAADDVVPSREEALRILRDVITCLEGAMPLTAIKRAHIKQVTEHFQKKELAIGSVNRYLGLFSASLHAAPLYFPDLDEWAPPRIPRLPGENKRERVLTRDELARIFTELNNGDYHEDIGDALRLMLLTGARKKELKKLTIASVNWDWKTAQFLKTKNKTNRTVALSDMLLEILRRREGKPLFGEVSNTTFLRSLRLASANAGVLYGDRVDGGWVPHDLRHTAATVMESAGVKYSAVAAVLGHKRSDQTATYTHVSLDDLRAAVAVLENWCREIDGFVRGQVQTSGAMCKSNFANPV